MDRKLRLQLNVKLPIKKTQTPVLPAWPSETNSPTSNFIKINGKQYPIEKGDFSSIKLLGSGTCGTVYMMEHRKTKTIFAVKEMMRSNLVEENKRINMDLEVLLKCNFSHIVQCFGHSIQGKRVWIFMELMPTCLEKLMQKVNAPFPEEICGKIAVASVNALDYLKVKHKIIHRDVKPSNILINENGEIKICDFGISGRLVNSVARTRLGCYAYISPERIQPDSNKPYDIRADIWSLGITLVQLATNSHPYPNCRSDFELSTKIIYDDAPSLPNDTFFTEYFREFVNSCLQKDVEQRPKYKDLKWYPFYIRHVRKNVEVRDWFNMVYFNNEITRDRIYVKIRKFLNANFRKFLNHFI